MNLELGWDAGEFHGYEQGSRSARAIIVSARDFRLFFDRDLGSSLELREAS
jgi:hypothetical protein